MKTVTLSARLVANDLRTEFGNILPAFLPIKNKAILQWHNEMCESQHYVTIDERYSLSEYEKFIISHTQAKVITVCETETILSAFRDIVSYFSVVENISASEPLRIMYGDSIVEVPEERLDSGKLVVGTTKIPDDGLWYNINGTNLTFAGFYQISLGQLTSILSTVGDEHQLYEALTQNKNTLLVDCSDTVDLGRSHTYHANKLRFSTTRHFNETKFNKYTFRKIGNLEKIIAEAEWFKNVNSKLKPYTPNLFATGGKSERGYYEIETLYDSDLADILIHGKLSDITTKKIFLEIEGFLKICWQANMNQTVNLRSILLQKLEKRFNSSEMQQFLNRNDNYDFGSGLYQKYLKLNKCLIRENDTMCISHGDLCFSNILYNFKKNTIKVIDPRGRALDDSENTVFGPKYYDLIKLGHSAIYGYDLVLRGLGASGAQIMPNAKTVSSLFWDIVSNCDEEYSKDEIALGIGNLFFTMIPLHSDNNSRQLAFFELANDIIGDL